MAHGEGHTPPATRAPESGPMMKDMVRDGLMGWCHTTRV